ncbi:hypothetical protein I5907_04740 [Panacibacter sp. DH6]|uniref:Uncharacterized protein n=1 Tax=Panacibacter microcysteis TaxID=2793269 RepID=A0A931E1V9_9BACT|nr:hypothetical protein [Panacibacter microcysteis]
MEKKLIEGVHYYFSDDGLMVFTRQYHLERGNCCGNGCMNCPYNYMSVAEPRRTQLIKEKKNRGTAQ